MTEALAFRDAPPEALPRLASLAARNRIENLEAISCKGLVAGLTAAASRRDVDGQPLADLAFRVLETPDGHSNSWAHALSEARITSEGDVARSWLGRRTARVLEDGLLIAALEGGICTAIDTELMLTALRRTMLTDIDDERFRDGALTRFALAMLRQLWLNEGVWLIEPDERLRIDELAVALFAAAPDRFAEISFPNLLKLALYLPLDELMDYGLNVEVAASLRPRGFAEVLRGEVAQRERERAHAASVQTLTQIEDATSLRVENQYVERPYPRWSSLSFLQPDRWREKMGSFFDENEGSVLSGGYDVLIAGAGTGRHACRSAHSHGAGANVLAIDLSRQSLAYGRARAEEYAISNISFSRADILRIGAVGRAFEVIESVGVLHHLADPEAGWRQLTKCLKPGGLMWIGLYSAISRSNITRIRQSPDYPGPDATEDEARAYRRALLCAPPQSDEADLRESIDAHSLSGFRDLVLHASEQQFTIPRISKFLDSESLSFRGFVLPETTWAAFTLRFPDDAWPGRLENWAIFEEENPRTFDAMYSFWCVKADS